MLARAECSHLSDLMMASVAIQPGLVGSMTYAPWALKFGLRHPRLPAPAKIKDLTRSDSFAPSLVATGSLLEDGRRVDGN